MIVVTQSNKTDVFEVAIASASALSMLGYTESEIKQKSITDLFKALKDRIVGRFSNSAADHEKFLKFSLGVMKSNQEAIRDGICIAKNVKGFEKSTPWKIYQGGKLFHHIKRLGAELTGLSKDKWNPSDFFIVSKNGEMDLERVKPENTDYVTYNEMVGCSKDICGVSLKGKKAFHGSLSWAVALKMLGINIVESALGRKNFVDMSKKELNEDGRVALERMVKYLQGFNRPGEEIFYGYRTHWNRLCEVMEDYHVESRGWGESMIGFYDFLNSIDKHSKIKVKSNSFYKKLEHVLAASYITASSQNRMSCHHKKCQSGVVEDVGVRNPEIKDIKLDKILVPLDGTANIYVRLKIKNKLVDMQFRSKGSKAQFIIMETLKNASDAFPLENLK